MVGFSSVCDTGADGFFSEDLESLRPRAKATALRIVGCPTLAEDVTQEALTRAFQAIQSGTQVGNVGAWLRRIVVHVALDALKARPSFDDAPQPSTNPFDSSGLAVRDALTRISPDHQAVLALAFGEGLSYKEIADALDIPMGTVASRISAAKASFKKQWGED